MKTFSKKLIPLIIFAVCCALLVCQHHYATARRASFEAERTRYMSDILRITNGTMPVLWISPEYSYISTAKYFDLSGNGNHATQDTADYRPQVKPPGLDFDGLEDYLDITNNFFNYSNFTILAWVKYDALTGDDYWQGCDAGQHAIGFNSDRVFVWGFHTQSGKQGTTAVSSNTWYHIALVRDNTGTRVYLNANSTPELNWSDTGSLQINDFNIGRGTAAGGYEFDGLVDEVRIYNIALSATQIQALYLAGLPKHRQ